MKTESEPIVIDTKEKLFEHFGKPEGNFFGISDSYMMSLERGMRIHSTMMDNYLRLIFSFYPKEIEIMEATRSGLGACLENRCG